jgi:mannose-6-phosphate isomerase-like protein (cupin superfamily)
MTLIYLKKGFFKMQEEKEFNALSLLGKWPIPGDEARKNKRLIHIPPEKMLRLIHGKKNHILVSFYVSNDFVHFGTIQIPCGIYSDPETHKGDEVLFVLKGKLTVEILDKNKDESVVIHDSYEINTGEKFIIPEEVKHRYFNFSDEILEFIFGVAPEL